MFSLIAHIVAYRRQTATARATATLSVAATPVVANDRHQQDLARAA